MSVAPIPVVTDFSYTELKERVEVLSRRVNSLTAMEVSLIDIDQTPSINITEDNSLLKLPDLSQIDCEELAEDLIACDEALAIAQAELAAAQQEIEELEDSLAGLNGCANIFFVGTYNTVSGSICTSTREDGKLDVTFNLTSQSLTASGGGATGTYNFTGTMKSSSGGFLGYVSSSPAPGVQYQWSTNPIPFVFTNSGTAISAGVAPASLAYIDWAIPGNPVSGRAYLT